MRKAKTERKTKETEILLEINLDGDGKSKIETGIGFFNHMLELFAKQSLFDLSITAKGDLQVDEHHTVEDIGIALGTAIEKALGEKKGITRYASNVLPMDEALTLVAIDISGRPYFAMDTKFDRERVGDLSTELVYDFFYALALNAKINLQIRSLAGRNTHHKIEGIFKALGRAFRAATEIDSRMKNEIPSTKGVL